MEKRSCTLENRVNGMPLRQSPSIQEVNISTPLKIFFVFNLEWKMLPCNMAAGIWRWGKVLIECNSISVWWIQAANDLTPNHNIYMSLSVHTVCGCGRGVWCIGGLNSPDIFKQGAPAFFFFFCCAWRIATFLFLFWN